MQVFKSDNSNRSHGLSDKSNAAAEVETLNSILDAVRDSEEESNIVDLSWVSAAIAGSDEGISLQKVASLYRCLRLGADASYREVESAFHKAANTLLRALDGTLLHNEQYSKEEFQLGFEALERVFMILRLPSQREKFARELSLHPEILSKAVYQEEKC